MTSERELDAATVALDCFGHSKQNSYAVLTGITGAGTSTIWHRKHGRPSLQQKAVTQQYLMPLRSVLLLITCPSQIKMDILYLLNLHAL